MTYRHPVFCVLHQWMNFWYYYMALVWLFVILAGLTVVVLFQYRNEDNLYQLTLISGVVQVVREGETIEIPQDELVPGDVVCVSAGTAFCDMLLIEGGATLVDEGALTGEAHPIGKMPVDRTLGEQVYDIKTHKRSTILAGTRVIQSESGRAICLKTASFTARGELIRDIFTYKRHQFKFDSEVPIVLAILLCYAIFAFAYVNERACASRPFQR
jgi:P-type Mg2+ transporter